MGELAGSTRAEALRHIMACERCQIIHRGVRALEDGAREAGMGPPRPAARATRWWIAASAVAAAAAVLLVWWRVGGDGPTRPRLRGGGATIIVTTRAQIAASGALTWSPVPSAARYRVDVFDGDGQPAGHGESAATSVAWPATITALGVYRWRVEALDANGEVVARSPLTPVELVR